MDAKWFIWRRVHRASSGNWQVFQGWLYVSLCEHFSLSHIYIYIIYWYVCIYTRWCLKSSLAFDMAPFFITSFLGGNLGWWITISIFTINIYIYLFIEKEREKDVYTFTRTHTHTHLTELQQCHRTKGGGLVLRNDDFRKIQDPNSPGYIRWKNR